jgi:hypothetical protein
MRVQPPWRKEVFVALTGNACSLELAHLPGKLLTRPEYWRVECCDVMTRGNVLEKQHLVTTEQRRRPLLQKHVHTTKQLGCIAIPVREGSKPSCASSSRRATRVVSTDARR